MNNKLNKYGDFAIPFNGVIINRDLYFPNANLKKSGKPFICLKNIIDPRKYKNSFGFENEKYIPYNGGYITSGTIGPYYDINPDYPRPFISVEVPSLSFGKRKSPKRKSKIVYCLPKQQKFPVNSKKRCSAALSYSRYAPDPCKIARCVKKNCKKYPDVGKYSKLMKRCIN